MEELQLQPETAQQSKPKEVPQRWRQTLSSKVLKHVKKSYKNGTPGVWVRSMISVIVGDLKKSGLSHAQFYVAHLNIYLQLRELCIDCLDLAPAHALSPDSLEKARVVQSLKLVHRSEEDAFCDLEKGIRDEWKQFEPQQRVLLLNDYAWIGSALIWLINRGKGSELNRLWESRKIAHRSQEFWEQVNAFMEDMPL